LSELLLHKSDGICQSDMSMIWACICVITSHLYT